MAKTPLKKQLPIKKVTKTVQRNPQANKQGIDALRAAISEKKEAPLPDIKKALEDVIQDPLKSESVTNNSVETITEPTITNIPPTKEEPLSIWNDIKKVTEEDQNIKPTIEIAADNLNESESEYSTIEGMANDASRGIDIDEENARKQSNLANASITVELIDVGFMFVCILLTWDFTDENQKKFKLNEQSKKAIKTNLYKVYEATGKVSNPKKQIWFLILGSYAPMLLVAFLIMFRNLREKQQSKKRKIEIQNMETMAIQRESDLKLQNEQLQKNIEILKQENAYNMELQKNKFTATTDRPFKGQPNMGKKLPIKKGSGVRSGIKRGPYKKAKK